MMMIWKSWKRQILERVGGIGERLLALLVVEDVVVKRFNPSKGLRLYSHIQHSQSIAIASKAKAHYSMQHHLSSNMFALDERQRFVMCTLYFVHCDWAYVC